MVITTNHLFQHTTRPSQTSKAGIFHQEGLPPRKKGPISKVKERVLAEEAKKSQGRRPECLYIVNEWVALFWDVKKEEINARRRRTWVSDTDSRPSSGKEMPRRKEPRHAPLFSDVVLKALGGVCLLKRHDLGVFSANRKPRRVNVGNAVFLCSKENDAKMIKAVRDFTEYCEDDKAAVILTAERAVVGAVDSWILFLFYDGPEPSKEVFQNFTDIGAVLNTARKRSFADMIAWSNWVVLPGFNVLGGTETIPLPDASKAETVLGDIHAHWRVRWPTWVRVGSWRRLRISPSRSGSCRRRGRGARI